MALISLAHEPSFQLGLAQVRPNATEVAVDDRIVFLEPRVMQVLVALARCPGEVVTHQTLIDLCWEGRVVTRDAIQRCILTLRKLSEAGAGFTIETIARIGYRLVTPPHDCRPVIAALPFASGDDAVGDGVAAGLVSRLSRRSDVRVIGQSSMLKFRLGDKVGGVARSGLPATHAIDGKIEQDKGELRISVALIDLADRRIVWRDTMSCVVAEAPLVARRIADAIADALGLPAQGGRSDGPVDAEAWRHFLLGQQSAADLSVYASQRAITHFREALALAPEFAPAWGQLARACAVSRWGESLEHEERLRCDAISAAERALALDPGCGAAHAARYHVAAPAGQFAQTERNLREAFAANAGESEIRAALYMHLFSVGRLREGYILAKESYELDPDNLATVFRFIVAQFTCGQTAQALVLVRTAVAQWPLASNLLGIGIIFAAFAKDFSLVDDLSAPERAAPIAPLDRAYIQRTTLIAAMMRQNDAGFGNVILERIERFAREGGVVNLAQLGFLSSIDRVDDCYRIASRISFAPYFAASARIEPHDGPSTLFIPPYAPLRADRRFPGLCARLGLVEYWRTTNNWPDCAADVGYDFKLECESAAPAFSG